VAQRSLTFSNGEYYHVFNHGIEGLNIVNDEHDSDRFEKCLGLFNSVEPIGSLYALSFETERPKKSKSRLVDVVAYCINPNHYHLVLRQKVDGGISEFIKRVTGGHSWYFNKKHKRKGTLFRGRFQAKHISNNEYLAHVSTYVNLNNKVHKLSGPAAKLVRSSWSKLGDDPSGICSPDVILTQFKSLPEYTEYALDALQGMLEKRSEYNELKEILIEE
jgi:hypothetical protein